MTDPRLATDPDPRFATDRFPLGSTVLTLGEEYTVTHVGRDRMTGAVALYLRGNGRTLTYYPDARESE